MPDQWALTVHEVSIPLVTPFVTSLGHEDAKQALVLELRTPFGTGYAECSADAVPTYAPEFLEGATIVLTRFLFPALARARVRTGAEATAAMAHIPGNQMAKSALEMAILDAEGRAAGRSLSTMLGGTRKYIDVGVSLGIPLALDDLLRTVDTHLAEGYRRIKLKIRPGWDVTPVAAVRAQFGDGLLLSVDANQSYSMADHHRMRLNQLDEYGLAMIEQPFPSDNLVDHARLAATLDTPLCLDESIRSVGDAETALALGACRIINIKPARVGGYLTARAIHDLAVSRDVMVWCGGMLETGIGRRANIALASLPGFTYPADISGTARYFAEDITPAIVPIDGRIAVSTDDGIGAHVEPEALHRFTRLVTESSATEQ